MKLTKCWTDKDGGEVLFFEPIDKGNYVVTFLLGENELEAFAKECFLAGGCNGEGNLSDYDMQAIEDYFSDFWAQRKGGL